MTFKVSYFIIGCSVNGLSDVTTSLIAMGCPSTLGESCNLVIVDWREIIGELGRHQILSLFPEEANIPTLVGILPTWPWSWCAFGIFKCCFIDRWHVGFIICK